LLLLQLQLCRMHQLPTSARWPDPTLTCCCCSSIIGSTRSCSSCCHVLLLLLHLLLQ
jgi:hypothetical protein